MFDSRSFDTRSFDSRSWLFGTIGRVFAKVIRVVSNISQAVSKSSGITKTKNIESKLYD